MDDVWRDVIEELADRPIFGAGREELHVQAGGYALDDDRSTFVEHTPVVLAGDCWIRIDKAGKVHAGMMAPKKTRGVVALKSGDDSNRWLGFALIGKGPHDIRPDLLALVRERNLIGVERCIRYGANYLLASGHHLDMGLLQAAAADALLILVYGETRGDGNLNAKRAIKRHRPQRPTLRKRERQFELAHGTWAPLRDAALTAYKRRYGEAVAAYADMPVGRVLRSGRSYSSGFRADPLHRDEWTASRRALVEWIEAMRAGRLTSTDRYNGCQTNHHRHEWFASRRRSAYERQLSLAENDMDQLQAACG